MRLVPPIEPERGDVAAGLGLPGPQGYRYDGAMRLVPPIDPQRGDVGEGGPIKA